MRLLNALCMLFACFLHAFCMLLMLGCWDSLSLILSRHQRQSWPRWCNASAFSRPREDVTRSTKLTRHLRNLGLSSKASLSSSSCRTSPRQIRTGKRPTEVCPNKKRTARITILKCENYVWFAWFFVPSEAVRSGMWDSCQMCVWNCLDSARNHKNLTLATATQSRKQPQQQFFEKLSRWVRVWTKFRIPRPPPPKAALKMMGKGRFSPRNDSLRWKHFSRIEKNLDASGRWDPLAFREFSGSHPWAQEWRSFQDLHDAIQ